MYRECIKWVGYGENSVSNGVYHHYIKCIIYVSRGITAVSYCV
jgi:hypothetical protein